MARMKLEMPKKWAFKTEIDVRVGDLNYGNHLANQQFLAFAQEARVKFFASYGYTELDFGGVALIQADAAIEFKGEGHLGDVIQITVALEQAGSSSFNIFYQFVNLTKDKLMANIRTALVCFDYDRGKPAAISEIALNSGIFDH
jgi:acyl-CoA thioester hydrolase